MGNGFFPGVKCGQGVTLTPQPLLVPRSKIEWSYTSTLSKGLCGLWKGEIYLLLIWINNSPENVRQNVNFNRNLIIKMRFTPTILKAQQIIWEFNCLRSEKLLSDACSIWSITSDWPPIVSPYCARHEICRHIQVLKSKSSVRNQAQHHKNV
jgi:hypothetical protein